MKLPNGHLSPSAMDAWEKCQLQFKTFRVEGAKSPPDFALMSKRSTHEVILEHDLKQKITTNVNLPNSQLSEVYRSIMEESVHEIKEDPNLETTAEKAVEAEVPYFDKILTGTKVWRDKIKPIAIEERVEGKIGGVPVVGYLDILEDDVVCTRVVDLKRRGKGRGDPTKSRQMVTYSKLRGVYDAALATIVENKMPKLVVEGGQIPPGEVSRVEEQYRVVADQIDHALEKDVWLPVDHGNDQKAWVCSAKFCGAWRKDARDWLTGRSIACPYGERAAVSVYLPGVPKKE